MSSGEANMTTTELVPLVEMRDIRVAFGGVHAVDGCTVDLYRGEVVGLVGGNGAGKSTLMRALSGAHPPDSGEIRIDGQPVSITNPRDAKTLAIETIYQTLALADNVDAPSNVFLGREVTTRLGSLDDSAMESATRTWMGRRPRSGQRSPRRCGPSSASSSRRASGSSWSATTSTTSSTSRTGSASCTTARSWARSTRMRSRSTRSWA